MRALNAQGIVTGNNTGSQWLYRHTLNNIVPVLGDNNDPHVHTIQQRIKAIGRGGLPSVFLTINFHFTVVGDDVTVYNSSMQLDCRD